MRIENNLPIEDNASDRQDSVRLAAICNAFGYKPYGRTEFFDMRRYFLPAGTWITLRDQPDVKFDAEGKIIYERPLKTSFDRDLVVRHPDEYKFDLSRDQWICFVSAAPKELIDRKHINGIDLMSPSVRGHELRCKGQKASWWHDLWLTAEMAAHAWFTPLSEPNQLLLMVRKAGKLKKYCSMNPQWREALRQYWIKTRAKPEVDLCEHTIKTIESEINQRDR